LSADRIAELQRRIVERQQIIDYYATRIKSLTEYLKLPLISITDRYMTQRVIIDLQYSNRSLEGWQTRDRRELEELEKPPPPPPPPPEQFIADEECSGYSIYYDLDNEIYNVRDPDTKELIRSEEKICLELTASIDTHEGHDVPLTVEITTTSYVKQKTIGELVTTERDTEKALRDYLIAIGFENVIKGFVKEGVAYNGEKHIQQRGWYTWQVPDFGDTHAFIEKKHPRERKYEGDFKVE